jgi:23S rRNA-/tRNA-specific pseudouridylate synthase
MERSRQARDSDQPFRKEASRTSVLTPVVAIMVLLMSVLCRRVQAWRPLASSLSPVPSCLLYSSSSSLESARNSTLNNNPSLWKGASHSSSEFVTHIVAGDDAPTVQEAIQRQLLFKRDRDSHDCYATSDEDDRIPLDNSRLCALHLLQLGSCWFLPATAPRDPSLGGKPVRLTESSANQILNKGDYLRLHHSPRRFPLVYDYDWSGWHPSVVVMKNNATSTSSSNTKAGVVLARDDEKGFWVLDKPANVPVHPTVDNGFENVAEMLRQAAKKDEAYVATPQRLDQNTSGLLVVATNKLFAAYFAQLLRRKTDLQLSSAYETDSDDEYSSEAIHKKYRCLVCLKQDSKTSMTDNLRRLQKYVNDQTLLRHYLEPSIRAPKRFATIPGNETWAECLLRVTRVGEPCALVGSKAAEDLAAALWNKREAVPSQCVAVVELDVELLTGRTHQIRGQLSADGFPLVGDAQYGGAVLSSIYRSEASYYVHSEQLALQCCQLEFLDPDLVVKGDGENLLFPSDRWNSYYLDESWWSSLLQRYQEQSNSSEEATVSSADLSLAQKLQTSRATTSEPASESLLPPRISLAPGSHKYVLVKATEPTTGQTLWFVKSAAPKDAGGPYHANVAEELVKWIEAIGYQAKVTGGGRIDYNEELGRATVYGFSYGFGKGDHARAASLITNESAGAIVASFNDSDSLY